jgi:hypothetical protein
MSVEFSDFIDDTELSNCCGAPRLDFDFCSQCREHAAFDYQCENFEECGNWVEAESSLNDECQECQDAYDRAHPHPLDIAEIEDREDRSAGLEGPWWRQP